LQAATTQSTQSSASNRIAELSAGQQMCAVDPAEATPAGAYAPAGLGQAARLSTKPDADSHSATIHRQLYPLSNYCFVPTMFFDLIMTKQCLNREDVKHRISLQHGCMHCQNASCHLDRSFDNIGRQKNPFKNAPRNVSLCSSNIVITLLYHKSNHGFIEIYHRLITLFLPLPSCGTPIEHQASKLEVTWRCRNVI
jgi:hypothetical protein